MFGKTKGCVFCSCPGVVCSGVCIRSSSVMRFETQGLSANRLITTGVSGNVFDRGAVGRSGGDAVVSFVRVG